MYQVYHPQAEVCTPYQHQYPGHDPHLWQSSKYHRKGTPGICGGILRSWEVTPGFGGGPGEEHGPVGEDWGCDGVKMRLGRRGREEGVQR